MNRKGFTLVELLTVVSIIAIIGALLVPVLAKAKASAKKINEINSAKQMILAWHLYADDHDGFVLPGYRYGFTARDRMGNKIGHPINARFPWRLAPWLGHNFESMYVNENSRLLDEFRNSDVSYVYASSLFPSLGVNSTFIGGDDLELSPTDEAFSAFGNFCVLKVDGVDHPSNLLVFLSAHHKFGDRIANGFYLVRSPYLAARRWESELNNSDPPGAVGYVHHRYNNHAISAMVDGHAESLSFRQTQNMRHWSNQADRHDWVLQQQ